MRSVNAVTRDSANLTEMTACPACGAPAELTDVTVLDSTDGPVEHARVTCIRRHWFFQPTAGLERGQVSADRPLPEPTRASVRSR